MKRQNTTIVEQGNRLRSDQVFEERVVQLFDQTLLKSYKTQHDGYRCHWLPRLFALMLVTGGTVLYGKNPSYLKFRAVEVIARIPYQSWQSVSFLLLTLFYRDEKRALLLAQTAEFARIAEENETMHVVVISSIAAKEEKERFFRDTAAPLFFAMFYSVVSFLLFLIKKSWSFELNYLFEQHAFNQYQLFLDQRKEALLEKSVQSKYLSWYGRFPKNQYEFFVSVRNDEIIHRNDSIEMISVVDPVQ